MSVEIKQLVIKSNIQDTSNEKGTSTSKKESGPPFEESTETLDKSELMAELSRLCKTIVNNELRRQKER